MANQYQAYRPGDIAETDANIMGQKGDNVRLVIDTTRHGPSWHRMEKLAVYGDNGKLTAVEALEQAGLDFQVVTVPIPPVQDPFVEGHALVPSKEVLIVRQPLQDDPESRIFGTASVDWHPLQNRTIAELLDKTGLTADYPVETMGALGMGETLFASLFVPPTTIAGEDYSRFIGLTDGKAANRSLSLFIGGNRMECQNTVRLATAGAEWSISLRHDRDLAANLEMAMEAIGNIDNRFEAYQQALEVLSTKKIAVKTVEQILRFAYPDPRPPAKVKIAQQLANMTRMTDANRESLLAATEKYEAWKRTQDGHREVAAERYSVFCQDFPKFAGTPYAVLQAVAEVESWRKSNKGGVKGADLIATGLLFGDRSTTILRAAVAAQRVSGVAVDSRYRKLESMAPSVRS